ncbi:MAG TPA: septal ring lytic transglycosylase RlpA family protein [bacterium]|mgnify:CR=1 FL=1|nr:septal ring lytic transglycosylase RlpA family protein [bacterium]
MKNFKFFASLLTLSLVFLATHNVLAENPRVPMSLGSAYVEKGKNLESINPKLKITVNKATSTAELRWALYMHYGYSFPSGWRPVSNVLEWNGLTPATLALKTDKFVAAGDTINTIKKVFYFDSGKNQWLAVNDFTVLSLEEVSFYAGKPGLYVILANNMMSIGDASWYKYKDCMCAASPDYPKGTKLNVTDLDTGKSIVVTVNDWGPERNIFPNRVIDLDVVAFEALGWSLKHGILKNIEVTPVE